VQLVAVERPRFERDVVGVLLAGARDWQRCVTRLEVSESRRGCRHRAGQVTIALVADGGAALAQEPLDGDCAGAFNRLAPLRSKEAKMNRKRLIRAAVGAGVLFGTMLIAATAAAAPIDNPCTNSASPCQFRFYVNSDMPFLTFSSGQSATDLPTENYFRANVDGSGNMTFHDSDMNLVPTDVTLTNVVKVRLTFTGLTGTTDLAGSPDVDWTMTAYATFTNQHDGITEANCQTGSFTIDVSGDWLDVDSDTFTIPAFTSTQCNNHGTLMNALFGLGTDGAVLSLYKFSGWNGANQLTGS
jgi:hypothetical protein